MIQGGIKVKSILVSLLFVLLAVSCTSIKLTYRNPIPGEPTGFSVQRGITNDLRDPDRGGGDPTRIGTLRNGYGMPYPFTTDNGQTVDGLFNDILEDAISEAGYTQKQADAPILVIDVIDFWCDGYIGQKITFVIDVKLMDSTGNKILAKERIEYDSAFVIAFSIREAETYYNTGLTEVLNKLVTALKSSKFKQYL